ncbi:MAG: hypothetical protein EHM35_12260, partial [Planctomycetaceae bacterium]
LGYSLRAIAERELGRYSEAVTHYDRAITLPTNDNSQRVNLVVQRSATLLEMGDYQRVISEAPAGAKDHPPLQYHLFGALTATGDFDKAAALFWQMVSPGQESRRQFENWCSKYVFDTLAAGRSWHPPGDQPKGAAFLPMVEAEEFHRSLSAKARRLTTEGAIAQWSPDGKKLVFHMGRQGYNGLALFDPATKETDLLITPGKDPKWSPDGRYIAFVRDYQVPRVMELVTGGPGKQQSPLTDQEVWIIRADGTEPRRVARGGWPSWSRDSTSLYYQSRVEKMLYSISITDPDAEPKRIVACPNYSPSVSPDNRRVACFEEGSLKVKGLESQAVLAEWPVPFSAWGGVGWSPTGNELCMGSYGGWENRHGLCIYSLDTGESTRVLGGQISTAFWSPDGTKLVFNLGAPYSEIWTADLDPSVSAVESLGPGQTLDEYFHEMVTLYTRRIEADPLDASLYPDRARYYDYLHDRGNATADMRRWSALLSQDVSSAWRLGGPCTLLSAVNGSSGDQLVVFVERQEDGAYALRIALGQKGRCKMKSFEIPVVITSLLGFCLLSGLDTLPAHADFVFGTPTNVGSRINTTGWNGCCTLSPDGLELYFGSGDDHIWTAQRATVSSAWGPASRVGSPVNSSSMDGGPFLSHDGLSLFFGSSRPGGLGQFDFWVA